MNPTAKLAQAVTLLQAEVEASRTYIRLLRHALYGTVKPSKAQLSDAWLAFVTAREAVDQNGTASGATSVSERTDL